MGSISLIIIAGNVKDEPWLSLKRRRSEKTLRGYRRRWVDRRTLQKQTARVGIHLFYVSCWVARLRSFLAWLLLAASQYSNKTCMFYFRSEALLVRIISTAWRSVCLTSETSTENNIEPRIHSATLSIHS